MGELLRKVKYRDDIQCKRFKLLPKKASRLTTKPADSVGTLMSPGLSLGLILIEKYISGNIFQKQKSYTLNRIHKALSQMNIKYQHIISDIEGAIGMQILLRIASGIQDAELILEGLNIKKLKASREELLKSLTGLYKPHYVKVLNHHLNAYRFFKEQMLAYEKEIEGLLEKLLPEKVEIKPKKSQVRKNQFHFNLKDYLHALIGVDLTQVPGLEENTILTIIAVTG